MDDGLGVAGLLDMGHIAFLLDNEPAPGIGSDLDTRVVGLVGTGRLDDPAESLLDGFPTAGLHSLAEGHSGDLKGSWPASLVGDALGSPGADLPDILVVRCHGSLDQGIRTIFPEWHVGPLRLANERPLSRPS